MKYQELLTNIPDKRETKDTTSLVFKQNIIEYFENLNLNRCIEIGTHVGYTTRILSFLFKEVITYELHAHRQERAKDFNADRSNIKFILGDIYASNSLNIDNIDVSFIDCVHSPSAVKLDINRSINAGAKYLIFDDYGIDLHMKETIDRFIEDTPNAEVTFIGEPKGSEPRIGRPLHDWEGVIVKL